MKKTKLGVKVYSYDWHLKHNLSPDSAANRLEEQGIDFVVAQNRYVPMATSAVESGLSKKKELKLKALSDRDFAESLQGSGIEYWAACNVFFAPEQLKKHPECRPVDQYGLGAKKIDWYVGICPSCESYWEERKSQIIRATEELQPDGVFLGFIRFPGFWELWLPQTERAEWPEFCFCSRCRKKFAEDMDIENISEQGDNQRDWILSKVYQKFVEWKTNLIVSRVREISESVKAIDQDIDIMINTLPFIGKDFSGAGSEVFGQDKEKLSSVADVFELMTYHQILGRQVHWIGNTISKLKERTPRSISSTIQVNPYYTEGMHADKGRETELTAQEFERAIKIAKNSGADRISLFTWSDLLMSKKKQKKLNNLT